MLQGSPLALLLELVRPGSSRSRRRATDESEGESRSVVILELSCHAKAVKCQMYQKSSSRKVEGAASSRA